MTLIGLALARPGATSGRRRSGLRFAAGLTLVLISAAAVHLWMFARTTVPARDGLAFARVAAQLDAAFGAGSASVVAALAASEHPPGYPLAVWLAWQPVRVAGTLPRPDQLLLAALFANVVIGVGLGVVHYRLGRVALGPRAGVVGALIFQFLPVAARVTSDALSEGLYLVAVGTALGVGVRAVRGARPGGYFLAGVAAGGAYLVRPEGLLVVLAVGLAGVCRGRRAGASRTAVGLASLACGAVLVGGPYAVAVGGLTNKPTGRKLFQVLGLTAADGATAGARGPQLFAAWAPPTPADSKALWAAAAFGAEASKAFHYAPAALAVCGLVALRRRFGTADPGVVCLAAFAGLNTVLVVGMGSVSGYLSERHVLPIVFVGCLFVPAGVRWVRTRACGTGGGIGAERRTYPVVTAALLLSAVPALLKQPHQNRVGHAEVGRWLARHIGTDDEIVDPYGWAQFYAGRTVDRVPPSHPAPQGVYAVLEVGAGKAPNSLLPKLPAAQWVAQAGRVVYHWPVGQPLDQARMVVCHVPGSGSGLVAEE